MAGYGLISPTFLICEKKGEISPVLRSCGRAPNFLGSFCNLPGIVMVTYSSHGQQLSVIPPPSVKSASGVTFNLVGGTMRLDSKGKRILKS